jgi:hypothetical protein
MANRNVRWLVLTIFALVNLVFWAGVAAAVGLAGSPSLNLGLETLIRDGQATAVAVWERFDQPPSNPALSAEGAVAIPKPASTTSGGDEPLAAVVSPGDLVPASTPRPDTTQGVDASAVSDGLPPPTPVATLVTSPLLLADPEIKDLDVLDAEMARSAPGRAVQIRYQEDTLNAEIAALWQNNPDLPYRNVRVDLMRDQVVVTGKVSVLGFGVNAEVTGKITVENCVPVLEIEQLRVAGVMTPKFVRDEVEEMVLEAMTWYPADYPLCLEQIVLEDTRATVYGYRR